MKFRTQMMMDVTADLIRAFASQDIKARVLLQDEFGKRGVAIITDRGRMACMSTDGNQAWATFVQPLVDWYRAQPSATQAA